VSWHEHDAAMHLLILDKPYRFHCYPGSYLDPSESPERLLETVERFEEDLTHPCGPS
jgi:hypothetical protein